MLIKERIIKMKDFIQVFIISIFFIQWFSCATFEKRELVPGIDLYSDNVTSIGVDFAEGRLWDRAKKVWKEELNKRPDYAPLYYNLGVAAARENRLKDASDFYKLALKKDPDRMYMEALSKLEKTSGIGRVFYNYLLDRTGKIRTGCQFARAGLWQEAIDIWQSIIKKKSNNPYVLYNLSLAWEVMGEHKKSLDFITKSITLRPNEEKKKMLNWLEGKEPAPFTLPTGEALKRLIFTENVKKNDDNATLKREKLKDAEKGLIYKYIATSGASLRSKPSVDSAVIKKLVLGEKVRLLSKHSDWYEIALKSGKRGWVYYRFITDETNPLGR